MFCHFEPLCQEIWTLKQSPQFPQPAVLSVYLYHHGLLSGQTWGHNRQTITMFYVVKYQFRIFSHSLLLAHFSLELSFPYVFFFLTTDMQDIWTGVNLHHDTFFSEGFISRKEI